MPSNIITLPQIKSKILTIRGQQVMLDRDLAEFYGVKTKRLNEAVKRNTERFPDTFRFQLTKQEFDELVAVCDRFKSLKHSTNPPYAFTESHDRFLIIDKKVIYHVGASLKDAGKKWFAVVKLDIDTNEVIKKLGGS